MGSKRKVEDMTKTMTKPDTAATGMKVVTHNNSKKTTKKRGRGSGENDRDESIKGPKRGRQQAGDQSVKKTISQSRAQKDKTEKRKSRKNPNFELIQLSMIAVVVGTSRLAKEIILKTKGKAALLCSSHKFSRVLQSCLKHCDDAEKLAVLDELRPVVLTLAKDTYAHHLVRLLFEIGDKDEKKRVVNAFRGHVVPLLKHPTSAQVVDYIFHECPKAHDRALLEVEFFGKQFSALPNFTGKARKEEDVLDINRIKDVLGLLPVRPRALLQALSQNIMPIIEKGLVDATIIHKILAEYLQYADKGVIEDVIDSLAGERLLHILHTREGSLAASFLFIAAGPKHRKQIVKALKSKVSQLSREEHGLNILITIAAYMDDTIFVKKVVHPELVRNMKEILADKYGRKVLLYFLAPENKSYFTPTILKITSGDPLSALYLGEKQHAPDEKLEITPAPPVSTSKKDASIRRQELVTKEMVAALVQLVCSNLESNIKTPVMADLITELLCSELTKPFEDDVQKLCDPILHLVQSADYNQEDNILCNYTSSRALKRIIRGYRTPPQHKSLAEIIYRDSIKANLVHWMNGSSAKVVVAILTSLSKATMEKAIAQVRQLIDSGAGLDDHAKALFEEMVSKEA